jgi:hypothetical protein
MNEKMLLHYFTVFGFAFMLSVISCASANAGTGQPVLDSAEQLGQLKAENAELTRELEFRRSVYQQLRNAIGDAEANAAGAGTDLERAREYFIGYKQAIDRYFQSVDSLPNQVKDGD